MLQLKEVQQYITGLGIAEQVYIGRLDNKKQKSIGVYPRSRSGSPVMALGGVHNSSYDMKALSFLVHWNKNPDETEQAAEELFSRLAGAGSVQMGETRVFGIRLMVPEPQNVGTDEGGVYEYVIWADFIYERNG